MASPLLCRGPTTILAVTVSSLLFVTYLVASAQAHEEPTEFGSLVDDIVGQRPSGVKLLYSGPKSQAFDRPLPLMVDSSLLSDFEDYFNHTQEFRADGLNTYQDDGHQFVASISGGYVTGVLGSVFDKHGRIYTELTRSIRGIPATSEELNGIHCKRFNKLATTIQKYGHMYYHFVQEVLPRITLMQPYLDADTKILMFGAPYEAAWLQLLGINPAQVEIYDPTVYYCADELIVPSPSKIITPAKEGYLELRAAAGASEPLPESERTKIIYCSRKNAEDRQVSNEEEVLDAIRATYPNEDLVVFTGDGVSVVETINLFRQAKVVMGVHGAGLSHSIFSAPGTAIVEFLFMYDPPMMFWHSAGALNQKYVMVPVAQTWWLASSVHVPAQDVVEALALVLPATDDTGCALGFAMSPNTECQPCTPGTYRALGASTCTTCPEGRVAPEAGSRFCSFCPEGTIAVNGQQCVPCANGERTLFPGSSNPEQCMSQDEMATVMDRMFAKERLAQKLVKVPALEMKAKNAKHSITTWFSQRRLHATMLEVQDLQFKFLDELFSSDNRPTSQQDIENIEEFQLEGRELLADEEEGYGRHLLADNGYGRRLLDGYGRRLLEDGYGRRQLVDGYGRRHLMADGYGRRHLADGYGRRHLVSDSYGRRHLLEEGYGRRHLSGDSYGRRRLHGYGRRRLMAYGRRNLQQYRRRMH